MPQLNKLTSILIHYHVRFCTSLSKYIAVINTCIQLLIQQVLVMCLLRYEHTSLSLVVFISRTGIHDHLLYGAVISAIITNVIIVTTAAVYNEVELDPKKEIK